MDSFVSCHVATTLGRMYASRAGRLPRYPIPPWPGPAAAAAGQSQRILDLGCGWGRWSFAAARAGHSPIGVDRSLEALQAARRVAAELVADGTLPMASSPHWVCADLDWLPFRSGSFEQVFAYGVWQYLPAAGRGAIAEAWRLLRPGGALRIQLPHQAGTRARLLRWLARLGVAARPSVTYWSLPEMRQLAAQAAAAGPLAAGPPRLAAEGFFSTNAQWEDRDLLPPHYRCLVVASRALWVLSRRWPGLLHLADAVWLETTRASPSTARASAAPKSAP
ncbi:MAG: class I SAM-dependent methyltransferase [Terriglobales bacterium]